MTIMPRVVFYDTKDQRMNVPVGTIIRTIDSRGKLLTGFWICVVSTEAGIWEWRGK